MHWLKCSWAARTGKLFYFGSSHSSNAACSCECFILTVKPEAGWCHCLWLTAWGLLSLCGCWLLSSCRWNLRNVAQFKGLQADTAASSSLHRPAAITHRTLEGPTTCRGNKKEKKRRFSLFKAFSLFRNTGSVALPTDDKQLEDCFLWAACCCDNNTLLRWCCQTVFLSWRSLTQLEAHRMPYNPIGSDSHSLTGNNFIEQRRTL